MQRSIVMHHSLVQQGRAHQVSQRSAQQTPLVHPSLCRFRSGIATPLQHKHFKSCRQASSDKSPTSYGEIETVGTTTDGSSTAGQRFFDAEDDDSDRPLDSLKDTQQGLQRDAEEVKNTAGSRFARFKDDITSATGDLQEDLGQLNVEELLENVADPKEFGKRGEPLFFGQLLLLVLIFFPPAFFKTLVSSVGLLSIIGGLFFSILGVRDMGSNFYPFTAARKGNKLVTKGLFRYVRHPIYCGLCFLSFGLCAITGSQARLALSVAFWVLLNYKATLEEAEMDRIHGEQYSEYRSRVSKLIPGLF